MKFIHKIMMVSVALATMAINAQDTKTMGTLNSTTVKTLNYEKNGSQIPYKVTIQEQRDYQSSFQQDEKNMENWNRSNEPAKVAKLISINSAVDNTIDRVLVLRYEKQLADTFELVPTKKGFAIAVDGKSLEYVVGEGIYFANTADRDFFFVDEF